MREEKAKSSKIQGQALRGREPRVVKGELSMRTEQYYRKRVRQIDGAGFDSFSG